MRRLLGYLETLWLPLTRQNLGFTLGSLGFFGVLWIALPRLLSFFLLPLAFSLLGLAGLLLACEQALFAGLEMRSEILRMRDRFEPAEIAGAIAVPFVFAFFPWITCVAVTGHLGLLRGFLAQILGGLTWINLFQSDAPLSDTTRYIYYSLLGLGILLFPMSCVMWNHYRSTEGLAAGVVEILRSQFRYMMVFLPIAIAAGACIGLAWLEGIVVEIALPLLIAYAALVISLACGQVLPLCHEAQE